MDWLIIGFMIATGWHMGTTLFEIFITLIFEIYHKHRKKKKRPVKKPT